MSEMDHPVTRSETQNNTPQGRCAKRGSNGGDSGSGTHTCTCIYTVYFCSKGRTSTDKNPSTTTPPPGSCPRFREQGVWAASAARGRIMVPIQEVVAGAQLAFTGKPTPSPIDNRPSTIDNRQSLSKSETRKYGNHVSLMSGYSPCYTGARPPHVSHHAETRRFRTDNPW